MGLSHSPLTISWNPSRCNQPSSNLLRPTWFSQ
jgi:hypothetical protein